MSAASSFIADLNFAGIGGAGSLGSPRQKQVMWARECARAKTSRSFATRRSSLGAGQSRF
jgi:hypothetical protein